MNREELQKVHDALSLLNSMVNCGDQHSSSSVNMTQAAFAILRKPLPPAMKEKIIEIVGFNMEPERAELIAQRVLDLFAVSGSAFNGIHK